MLVGLVTAIVSIMVILNHELIWLLAVFPGLYIIYAFNIALSNKPLKKSIEETLTPSEKEAWEQHQAFLQFPSAAVGMAATLSLLQFMSIILGVILLISGLTWGILIAAFWFILGSITPRLNPTTSYMPAAQKGDSRAMERVQALKSLQEKLNLGIRD